MAEEKAESVFKSCLTEAEIIEAKKELASAYMNASLLETLKNYNGFDFLSLSQVGKRLHTTS